MEPSSRDRSVALRRLISDVQTGKDEFVPLEARKQPAPFRWDRLKGTPWYISATDNFRKEDLLL